VSLMTWVKRGSCSVQGIKEGGGGNKKSTKLEKKESTFMTSGTCGLPTLVLKKRRTGREGVRGKKLGVWGFGGGDDPQINGDSESLVHESALNLNNLGGGKRGFHPTFYDMQGGFTTTKSTGEKSSRKRSMRICAKTGAIRFKKKKSKLYPVRSGVQSRIKKAAGYITHTPI